MILNIDESFTRKIRSKKNDELTTKADTAFIPNGVYILHETLGVRTVDGWNPEDNEGVVGILLVEDDHKIVVALEDAPKYLTWSKKREEINEPINLSRDAESDFNGEYYCRNLNSPKFPAAYYCLNYKKGGRNWYLPSAGELWMICRHLKEIQYALLIVGGQMFVTELDDDDFYVSKYWSSTENSPEDAWGMCLYEGDFEWGYKVYDGFKVRPVSKFGPSNTLKESFTRKIRSKKNDELTAKADTAFVPDGVYILHETLGVRTVDSWNSENNNGVVGVLVVEDEHRIVVALEDAPEDLPWSKESELLNQPIEELEEAESDFNGEEHCIGLNSPDFPAAYYCKTYNKGGRSWYLPSYGELWMIYSHFDEIQNALSIVGGQKLITTWDEGGPVYWSSTEGYATVAWGLNLDNGDIGWHTKVSGSCKVRPVSKFGPSKTLKESFTRKIRSKKNDELTTKADTAFIPDGVYILHDTLGVRTVVGWNPKDNEGVVGILLVEDDHKIVVALEDSPENLTWSNEHGLINQPVDEFKDAQNDFNGEYYCRKLDSPDYPAAYYCLNYKKGNRNWYLPSSGELWSIYNHLEEIQNALSIVGGQKLVTIWDDDVPVYWSSTEGSAMNAWYLNLRGGYLHSCHSKVKHSSKVRPVSKFGPSKTLKESFTRKIRSKKNDELTTKADTAFVPDGVYILHDTLGVKGVEGWNPKNNDGVIGILLIEDDHKIVIATEDAPVKLKWSKKRGLINEPICAQDEAVSDFNGEIYCRRLDSPDFPAAYYCLNYNKGGRDWYLPSMGELWLIRNHLEEIQTALSIVGGQKFITTWVDETPCYWSSTEYNYTRAWHLFLSDGYLGNWYDRVNTSCKVRPVSKFDFSTLKESFTRKIRSKKNDELTIKADTAFVPDGVYILHETLGVRTVDSWNPKNNNGVVGILLVEDDHKIVVATEDAPNKLYWSKKCKLNNEPICAQDEAASDFNGEYYCQNLKDSVCFTNCFAVYYCKTYNKGNRNWYLPSSGELWMIYNHLEEIQNALETVGGQKFATEWNDGVYWSSTERNYVCAWYLHLSNGNLNFIGKYVKEFHVRPVSKFGPSTLKESFTRKIRSKKNDELTTKADTDFVPDGVYILHETLGVITVDGWNPKNNKGVVGILFIEDDHKIVVATEDAPENLTWSNEYELINQPVDELKDIESDFNGEYYCQKLDSPDFPAAYYCKTYNKGGRSWHLPSSGELWLIYRHLDEIQNALETVGGQKLVTNWDEDITLYWSSTERSPAYAWHLCLFDGYFNGWYSKVNNILKVRPVSAFSV